MAKYRRVAREVEPLIFMAITKDPRNIIGQGPAQTIFTG